METWKEVPGLETRYLASDKGRIYSLIRNKVLKTSLDERGYVKVVIVTETNKPRCTRAHILVCKAFHGLPPTDLHNVNHKDGNKQNNDPSNLEWVTRKENSQHFYSQLNGIEKRPRGHGVHWCANYTDDEVRLIRQLHKKGLGYHRIRKELGNKTSWVAIQMIVTGKTYYHVEN